jgi:hypothetical protein
MKFNAAAQGKKVMLINAKLNTLLAEKTFSGEKLAEKFAQDMREFEQRGFLTVAFVGEYSAGKSTIISALTQRRDIKISADIATDETTTYPWHGISVIDTPGLWTERRDHDYITLEAISRADLLVYCLTYSLFDTTTLASFNHLSFEKNFQSKMLLLVNKMSAEAGDDDEKVANYSTSLTDSLHPHPLTNFPVFFCDALDYIDGRDNNDAAMIELSRFDSFIAGLNTFVANKGALARLDTPIRIVFSYLDKASDMASRTGSDDDAYTQILSRISRSADRNRQSLRLDVASILIDLEASITKIGRNLAQGVGENSHLEQDIKKTEITIERLCEETKQKFQRAVELSCKKLSDDIGSDFDSPLMHSYLSYAERKMSHDGVQLSHSSIEIKNNIEFLKKIASAVGTPIQKLALSKTLKEGVSSSGASVTGLATSAQVSGSLLHSGIYSTGKFIGVNFKPWQAVNLAKNIGNAVAVVGVVLSVVSLFADIISEAEADENERKISEAKSELLNEYEHVGSLITKSFNDALRKVEGDVFDQIDNMVSGIRVAHETNMASSNQVMAEIVTIRTMAKTLLTEVTLSLN